MLIADVVQVNICPHVVVQVNNEAGEGKKGD